MNKRKRAINKAELIAVRAYTVVGNNTGAPDDTSLQHYFAIGAKVTRCPEHDPDYGMLDGLNKDGVSIRQYVDKGHLI